MAVGTTTRKPKETLTVNAKDITWIKDALSKLKDKVDTIEKTTLSDKLSDLGKLRASWIAS
jgi:hypothetical protein